MPEINTKIWMALKNRIAEAAGDLAVAYPSGETFEPPVDGARRLPYLAVGVTFAPPVRQFIGSRKAQGRSGILTVVYVEPLGPAFAAHLEAASKILSPHFAEDTCVEFGGVIVSFPNEMAVQAGYRDEGYWRTPVLINWEARNT